MYIHNYIQNIQHFFLFSKVSQYSNWRSGNTLTLIAMMCVR